ncbi:Hypothetical predicted protein [Podarcis lilfordi]|uniref:Uncharacterized protein n=1 Tax=Podarcis lilfordi TaxID=74358 RepID=A0AA35JST5_9SAUR|nr:Hypothetical predicted protein [Podarcis lilfordi]
MSAVPPRPCGLMRDKKNRREASRTRKDIKVCASQMGGVIPDQADAINRMADVLNSSGSTKFKFCCTKQSGMGHLA